MRIITINGSRFTLAEIMEMFGMVPLVLIISALLLAVVAIALVVFLGLWTYSDAKERTDEPAFWTLIVLFIPMPIGLIIYLVAGRRDAASQSSNSFLKPLITTAVFFMINLFVVIGSAIYFIILLADYGMLDAMWWTFS